MLKETFFLLCNSKGKLLHNSARGGGGVALRCITKLSTDKQRKDTFNAGLLCLFGRSPELCERLLSLAVRRSRRVRVDTGPAWRRNLLGFSPLTFGARFAKLLQSAF